MRPRSSPLSAEVILRAEASLGAVDGAAFDEAAALLRAEQPHLLVSVISVAAPHGELVLRLQLELLVVHWLALRLHKGRPTRQVSRSSFRKRFAEVGAWMDRMGEVDERFLRRWEERAEGLTEPALVRHLVRRLFDVAPGTRLSDGLRALVFHAALAAYEAQRAAGSHRLDRARPPRRRSARR